MTNDFFKWANRWLDLADHVAQWSKDRSTKVGCVIVGSSNQVLSLGYNGFPRGVNDTMPDRDERPLKYKWTEHAERNSIYNAARTGTSLVGSTIYISLFPCTDCARAIAQSGIAQLVTTCPPNDKNFMDRWGADFRISSDILTESSVRVSYVEKRTLV